MSFIKVSGYFHKRFSALNHLEETGFKEWLFRPGMEFGSGEKWWGDHGERGDPHEGIDLCLYRDSDGNTRYLDETTVVPVISGGRVEKVLKDFLGESVFVSHGQYRDGKLLYTIYGHIVPADGVKPGRVLEEGEVIGNIADAAKRGTSVRSHLHISAALVRESVKPEEFDWDTLGKHPGIELVNPLDFIELPYSVESE